MRKHALIIGAGGFGYHTARIISHDYGKRFDSVVISTTSQEKSDTLAEKLRETASTKIVPVEIKTFDDSKRVLVDYSPDFVAITAKDKEIGDDIHPLLLEKSWAFGTNIIEKPFARSFGDGSSILDNHFLLEHVKRYQFRIGIELPMKVINHSFGLNPELMKRIAQAQKLTFKWSSPKSDADLTDNLLLHPWSLIPEYYESSKAISVPDLSNENERRHMYNFTSFNNQELLVQIDLSYGKSFSGFSIDEGYTVAIEREGVKNNLVHYNKPLNKLFEEGAEKEEGTHLLSVNNPLKIQLARALDLDFVADGQILIDSQMFVEQSKGYKIER